LCIVKDEKATGKIRGTEEGIKENSKKMLKGKRLWVNEGVRKETGV